MNPTACFVNASAFASNEVSVNEAQASPDTVDLPFYSSLLGVCTLGADSRRRVRACIRTFFSPPTDGPSGRLLTMRTRAYSWKNEHYRFREISRDSEYNVACLESVRRVVRQFLSTLTLCIQNHVSNEWIKIHETEQRSRELFQCLRLTGIDRLLANTDKRSRSTELRFNTRTITSGWCH